MVPRTLNQGMEPNQFDYFSTAAGPDISDLAGPPGSVLDIYPSGEAMASSEQAVAYGRGSGGPGGIVGRFLGPTGQALAMAVIGGLMVHAYARS